MKVEHYYYVSILFHYICALDYCTKENCKISKDYCIIGAGPSGLQMGYFLEKSKRDYLIFEKAEKPGSFFEKYPRHRKLISINKRHTGKSNKEFNLRHDWNSLISDNENLLFTKYSKDYFPHADEMVKYLSDFQQKLNIKIQFNTEISNLAFHENKTHRFSMNDQEKKEYFCKCVFIATGFSVPVHPITLLGQELVEHYENVSVNPNDFEGHSVLILGKGNSGFEMATSLYGHASFIHVVGRNRIRLSWETHYVGDLRAINNELLDSYMLKSLDGIIEGSISEINLNRSANDKIHLYLQPFSFVDNRSPTNEAVLPGNEYHDVTNEAVLPGNEYHDVTNEAVLPVNEYHDVTNEAVLPGNEYHHDVTNEDALPANEYHDVTNEDALPANEYHDVTNEDALPANEYHDATNEDALPANEYHDVTNEDSLPANEYHDVANEDALPANEYHDVTNEDALPGNEYNKAAMSESMHDNQDNVKTLSNDDEKIEDYDYNLFSSDNFAARDGYDRVISCLGFTWDRKLYDSSTVPFGSEIIAKRLQHHLASRVRNKFPDILYDYESTQFPGMYFLGPLSHSLDFRKSAGGFIHGFRYTARALHHLLEWKNHDIPWPSTSKESMELLPMVLKRVNEGSGIYQMFENLGDVAIMNKKENTFTYLEEYPINLLAQLVNKTGHQFDPERHALLVIVLEYGKNWSEAGKDHFREDRASADPLDAHTSNFLHSVFYFYHRLPTERDMELREMDETLPEPTGIHHIIEDFTTTFDAPQSHLEPFRQFLEYYLDSDLRSFNESSCLFQKLTSHPADVCPYCRKIAEFVI